MNIKNTFLKFTKNKAMSIVVVLVLFCLSSCGSNNDSTEDYPIQKEVIKNQPIFIFDSIIHYSTVISEDTLWGIERIRDKTADQRRLIEVVLYEQITSLSDTLFLKHLPNLGYSKQLVSFEKCSELRKILQIQNMRDEGSTICVPIYRDILVFRYKSKNTGILKLCFDCYRHTAIGTEAKTKNINVEGWKTLKKILYP